MTAPPAVIDTNVVVAALVTPARAPTALILEAMLDGRRPFLLSFELLAEWNEVLHRPRIARRHGLRESEIEAILTELAARAAVRAIRPPAQRGTSGDEHVVALVEADARAVLVSGDAALRSRLAERALTPREFVDRWPL